ncbi:MAG TPA: hypothetical protein VIQ51_18085 [Chryseosolibacter sp.]
MDKKRIEKEKRETPIIDGDARPDMPLDPNEEIKKDKEQNDKQSSGKKFESERSSDINTLEDHRDAK